MKMRGIFVLGWPLTTTQLEIRTPLQIDLFLSRHLGWTQWSNWKPCEAGLAKIFKSLIFNTIKVIF